MHELSIAQSIIDYAVAEAEEKKAKRVREIQIEVGELMQVDLNSLKALVKVLLADPRLNGCKVGWRKVSAHFLCRKCGRSWGMHEAKRQLQGTVDTLLVREPDSKELPLHFFPGLYTSFLRCPRCGSADLSATSGEDVRLRRLVLE